MKVVEILYGSVRAEVPAARLRTHIDELATHLRELGVELKADPISDRDLARIASEFNASPLIGTTRIAQNFAKVLLEPHGRYRCIVSCDPEHEFARHARESSDGIAVWGAIVGPICLAYHPDPANKVTIWHEILHSLGAVDCYGDVPERKRAECDLMGCIMEYDTTLQTLANGGKWPFLCSDNLELIRQWIAAR